LEKLDKETSQ